ncbi:MAG: hypothetical protein KAQ62_10605 [Cyclobacteriaceae bacterium]|nr:hypothetical protein [Cyclobacteriaceae bacterium]MCK5368996.1 hypothetical protein [Cyclobacteriaceae bacterium]
MAQLLLPLFPPETTLITPILGLRRQDGLVTYFLSGMPIYSHGINELHKFRFTTSNFILQGLCKGSDIERTFHVSADSIRRWKKRLQDEGEEAFFNEDKRHGRSHKLLPDMLTRIQLELDKGRSVNSIAKDENISEGSIRYSIGLGRLKKR